MHSSLRSCAIRQVRRTRGCCGALPKALAASGADVLTITPLYALTDPARLRNRIIDDLQVEWLGARRTVGVWYSDHIGAPTFLLDAPEYFSRPGIYGYRDDHERFAFFSRAALALLRRLGEAPQVIHANDWQCGFAAVEAGGLRAVDPYFARSRSLFSIHNLAYQGTFDSAELPRLGFGSAAARDLFMMNGAASPMKAGLMASDMLSTVSPRYALEIQTPEQGYGLDWLLRMRSNRLVGITNGIDYDVWNPATDPHLAAHYHANDLSGKRLCKLDLLRRLGLPEEADRPLIAMVTRLVDQKGLDLVRAASGSILETGAFFVVLGSGADEYEQFLQQWRDDAPHRIGIYKGFNEALAHQIEAGADIFLMPSLYEPCGLNQMYSMRYGTVPVGRATGGLDDTVAEFDRLCQTGNGFKFGRYDSFSMLESIYEALYCYADPELWSVVRINGMRTNNSWPTAAGRYMDLYRAVTQT
ncbi:MAG: glycogen/starch synthase [Pyrinomonadaceae bacterium]